MRDRAARWGRASRAATPRPRALPWAPGLSPGIRQRFAGLAMAVAVAIVLTYLMLLLRGHVSTANVALLYLIPVLVGSTVGGLLPATVVAVGCVLALDLLFVLPYGALDIANGQDSLTLLLFLGLAALTSELAARARARADEAQRRARATALLYDLSGALTAPDLNGILTGLSERLGRIFALQSCAVLLADAEGTLRDHGYWALPNSEPNGHGGERDVAAAAAWALRHGRSVGLTLQRHPGPPPWGNPPGGCSTPLDGAAEAPAIVLFVPLRGSNQPVGLLRLVRQASVRFTDEDERLLETFATQAALAIERAQLAQEAADAVVARESDRAKSALLSSVSHELRTPLATIRGAADALRQEAVSTDATLRDELLCSIAEEAERLSVLVANLLDLSRIEAGALHPRRHLYDVAEIAARVAQRLAPRLVNHRLALDLPPGGLYALVDYVQIEAVLANLLDNAAKYAPPGTAVTLRLGTEAGEAMVWVEDEGPGIAPEHRQQVFSKFYRVPGPATRAVPGTGLGLAICKGIVDAHGGSIRALATPTGGARLEVRLPLAHAEAA